MSTPKIIYTKTDEAPALATYSLLPIVRAFTKAADIEVETRDISLAGRIIAGFPERLTEAQRQPDDLAELGALAKTPAANIIKLPNISASIPQLKAAIRELREQGYDLPDYPDEPETPEQQEIKARYARVLGSAVNPVLREGNSDRRVAAAVKQYAKANPHSMGAWSGDSRSRVSHMSDGDFYSSEQSRVVASAGQLRIEHVDTKGTTRVLREAVPVQEGEVIDAAVMNTRLLREFFAGAVEAAKADGVLLSLHLKATMMKVSDPIMFGHAVRVFYAEVFDQHAALFEELGVEPNNGIGDVYSRISELPEEQRAAVEADLAAVYAHRPALAMVNSDKGITNLHVPSDVIIDASMPAMLRSSGKMWGPDGELHDTLAMIPDRCYAGIYQAVIDDCREHGAFDVTTMGNVSNVGLMAQKAEEYGSHDKTFEIPADGRVRVVDAADAVLMEHSVETGDIWRMCQTRDLPIRDWVRLAVSRARATGATAIFWLDETPRTRRQPDHQSERVSAGPRHQRPGHSHRGTGDGHADYAEARPRRTGHDLGNRQRPARLPDRPVPDPGTRYQRENAVYRAAAGRRRPVRDRRGRLGAQARAAIPGRGPPALGFAGRVPGAGGVDRRSCRENRQRAGRRAGKSARSGEQPVPRQQ
jgi:isocitrate dehydrogenase